jgi:hypothetical protein
MSIVIQMGTRDRRPLPSLPRLGRGATAPSTLVQKATRLHAQSPNLAAVVERLIDRMLDELEGGA